MTGTVTRAPALDTNVKVDSIMDQFSVNKTQLDGARERLYTDYSFTDTFDNNVEGWKGTALKVLEVFAFIATAGGLGIWAGTKANTVRNQNAARNTIRNPQDFSAQVKFLHGINNTVQDSSSGKLTNDHRNATSLGSEGSATKGLAERQDTVANYQQSLVKINEAIDQVAKGLSADDRRALYAAFVADAAKNGGLSQVESSGESEQSFAIAASKAEWYKGNAQIAARDIAQKVGTVASPTGKTTAQRIADIGAAQDSLAARETEIIVEAARVVELLGKGTVPKTGEGKYDVSAALTMPAVQAEVAVIRKEYSTAVAPKADAEIKAAAQRVSDARDIDKLKKSFLNDRKGELMALAGNSEKGEAQLVSAIEFLSVSDFAKGKTADQFGIPKKDLEARNEALAANAPQVQKSLDSSTQFLSELNKNFAAYVAEKEDEAKANVEYIADLLQHKVGEPTEDRSSKVEQDNTRLVDTVFEGKVETEILGVKVKPAITEAEVGSAEALKTEDYVDLLKIVVGSGKDQTPGSPTLAAALMDSLHDKGLLPAVFAELKIANASKDTTALQGDLRNAQQAVSDRQSDIEAADRHVKSFWRGGSAYDQAVQKHKDAIEAHQRAEERVVQLTNQLATAKTQVGSNAYVVNRQPTGVTDDERNANTALIKQRLVKTFTDSDGAIKELRQALGILKKETASVDGSGKADGEKDSK